ncbi:hypothetical protein BGX21_008746 [Mortierella sp. AD011]|nr:hypothetical protein BGX20_002834 [Mortierella sp. AD010]KAF9397547.1 hypothetical protein BGX21_008746 [Mortierella sp. AD011]
MTSGIVETLSKESLRQGAVTPEVLYLKLYGAIQDAGTKIIYACLSPYQLDHRNTEDTLVCLNKIGSRWWNSPIYHASITYHLFSKPRYFREAEIAPDRYLEHIKTPLLDSLDSNKLDTIPALKQSYQEKEWSSKIMIRKWLKLQRDTSKCEEIKAQYEKDVLDLWTHYEILSGFRL